MALPDLEISMMAIVAVTVFVVAYLLIATEWV